MSPPSKVIAPRPSSSLQVVIREIMPSSGRPIHTQLYTQVRFWVLWQWALRLKFAHVSPS